MNITALRARLLTAFFLFVLVAVVGIVGYYMIGDGRWSLFDCLYMTTITLSTVGYGEVLPGMESVPNARGFTVLLLIFGTAALVYFGAIFTAFLIEVDLSHYFRQRRLRKRIVKMKEHVVVCGAGSTGRHIIKELVANGTHVLAVDTNKNILEELHEEYGDRFAFIHGDATDDHVLGGLRIEAAKGVAAALSSDKDNLYVCLATRLLNSKARIIARCAEVGHVEKLRRAGADAVVSPNHIGGMRMVSEMLRPMVVRFLDDMVRDARSAVRIDEVALTGNATMVGKSLKEAGIRERFGMTVLALRESTNPWIYNPEPTVVLQGGMIMVVLGSREQVAALRAEA